MLRRSDAITVVAPAMRDVLAACDPRLDGARVPVIPMGVDLARFWPALRDPDWLRRHGLRPPVVLFVGRLVEKKGLATLLDAFARLPLPATLALCGDGPEAANLRQRAEGLGLAGRVRFLGPLDHTALGTAYASCDLFCAPSIRAPSGDLDGMPTVLAEAAASGLPLLGSDLAGLPLLIQPGRTGLLVPPGDVVALADALGRLLGDEALRRRLGAGALDKAQGFTWSRIAARFVQVYAAACPTFAEAVADGPRREREGWFRGVQPLFGFYARALAPWLETFEPARVRVYLYDDLVADPAGLVRDLYRVIGVDDGFVPDLSRRFNVTGVIKNPVLRVLWLKSRNLRSRLMPFVPMALRGRFFDMARLPVRQVRGEPLEPGLRAELTATYRDDILALSRLLGRNLDAWLDSTRPAAAPGRPST